MMVQKSFCTRLSASVTATFGISTKPKARRVSIDVRDFWK
jgi:hypothetical protein